MTDTNAIKGGGAGIAAETAIESVGLKLLISLIFFFVTFVIFVVNKNFQSVFINSFKVSIVLTLTKQYY